jgi:phosphomecalonate degydratase large subunit
LNGTKGDILAKLMKLLVKLGDSFNAEKLINIKSAHTVLNFGLNFMNAAADILTKVADAGLKVKVRTTADPIVDMTFATELGGIAKLFVLQDRLVKDLTRIGVKGFTCTPYFTDNKPNFGDHCAWSESSAVIFLNSVIGARSNREGGVLDIASAITGKTPNYGLHLDKNRKGQILFKILFDNWNLFELTSIGLKIGEIAGRNIPVIEGLKNITTDQIKNLGAASAATGAVALIHVLGVTPEAKTKEMAFQNDKPLDNIEIDRNTLKDVQEKYSTKWAESPKSVTIGCPQLSKDEVIAVLKKLEGKTILPNLYLWICCCEEVRSIIKNSKYYEIVEKSGAKLATLCPMLTPLQRPLITNSGKTCFYTNATYSDLDTCIKIATEGK